MSVKIEPPANFKNFLAGDFKKVCIDCNKDNLRKQKQFITKKAKLIQKGNVTLKHIEHIKFWRYFYVANIFI